MNIMGFNKTTLLDYPGHLACTIFTASCNFRCPFCHNSALVIHPELSNLINSKDVLDYILLRKNILEGVCITGGEPTIQHDLPQFLQQIKSYGLLVKLDTNGYNPDILQSLIDSDLVDYVAMDIKTSAKKYGIVTGYPDIDINRIMTSLNILKRDKIPYELRTTVAKGLHTITDFPEIGHMIDGCHNYYLQNYRDSDNVINRIYYPYGKDELLEIKNIMKKYSENVFIRGVE